MRKLLLLLAVFACSLSAMATDAVTAKVSGTSLKIGLVNEVTYVAFQMDITLPKAVNATDFAAVANRLSQTGEDNTIGSAKFIVATNEISSDAETHTYRVIAYNLANAAIAGTSGDDILNITLSATVADPTTDVKVSEILFVKQSDLAEVGLSDAYGQNGVVKGDVNKDTRVTIADITALVKIITKADAGLDFDYNAADINNDTRYTVADITGIVNIITKK